MAPPGPSDGMGHIYGMPPRANPAPKVRAIARSRSLHVEEFIEGLFGDDLHAKRVMSLTNATAGAIRAATLGVHAIGLALARERGLGEKHAIKQVDRFFSNNRIDPWSLADKWVPFVVGQRADIRVAMDWTDFDADGHATLMLAMLTSHGRATPLIWRTYYKSTLRGHRNEYENDLLRRLRETLPEGVQAVVLADRGFADKNLYGFLTGSLGFGYLIRFRGCIYVTARNGETRRADAWVGRGGRAKTLRQAAVTHDRYVVPTVVCVHARGMEEAWCLASSDPKASATSLIELYAKRWSIEPSFRDTKDLHYGMGLSWTHIHRPDRRDRVLLVAAIAIAILTMLGAAGESLGMDRMLKANTVATRKYSLFRQGLLYYLKIPTMAESQLAALMARFDDILNQHASLRASLGVL